MYCCHDDGRISVAGTCIDNFPPQHRCDAEPRVHVRDVFQTDARARAGVVCRWLAASLTRRSACVTICHTLAPNAFCAIPVRTGADSRNKSMSKLGYGCVPPLLSHPPAKGGRAVDARTQSDSGIVSAPKRLPKLAAALMHLAAAQCIRLHSRVEQYMTIKHALWVIKLRLPWAASRSAVCLCFSHSLSLARYIRLCLSACPPTQIVCRTR